MPQPSKPKPKSDKPRKQTWRRPTFKSGTLFESNSLACAKMMFGDGSEQCAEAGDFKTS